MVECSRPVRSQSAVGTLFPPQGGSGTFFQEHVLLWCDDGSDTAAGCSYLPADTGQSYRCLCFQFPISPHTDGMLSHFLYQRAGVQQFCPAGLPSAEKFCLWSQPFPQNLTSSLFRPWFWFWFLFGPCFWIVSETTLQHVMFWLSLTCCHANHYFWWAGLNAKGSSRTCQ